MGQDYRHEVGSPGQTPRRTPVARPTKKRRDEKKTDQHKTAFFGGTRRPQRLCTVRDWKIQCWTLETEECSGPLEAGLRVGIESPSGSSTF